MQNDKLIVLFDNNCNMCSWLGRWLIKADAAQNLVLISQQKYMDSSSPHDPIAIHLQTTDELVVLHRDKITSGAEALLEILNQLDGFYRLSKQLLSALPSPLLELTYSLVARNRYRWFGSRNSCKL